MSRSSTRVLRDMQLHQMGGEAASRGIKQLTRLCSRRLRRNAIAALLVLLIPLVLEAALFLVGIKLKPHAWPTLHMMLGILSMIGWTAALAVWLYALGSSIEQLLVLGRVRRSARRLPDRSGTLQPQS